MREDSAPGAASGPRVLHLAAECYPLAKAGGLGDVLGALAPAQRRAGLDARVAMPGYRGLARWLNGRRVEMIQVPGFEFTVLEGRLDGGLPVYLFECEALFDRAGDPYRDESGQEHPDNLLRFACFARAAARFADSGVAGFVPQVVHAHDWQAALALAWLGEWQSTQRRVLTIHNLAYQGLFDQGLFQRLALPGHWWSPAGLEFWGQGSCLKAGIRWAEGLSTVSPRYAAEIQTAEQGCGLEDLLRERAGALRGILNGIDLEVWDPARDRLLAANYSVDDAGPGKSANKSMLQEQLGLRRAEVPLVAFIGRLVHQKGADLILAARDELLRLDAQYVVLGTGEPALERSFLDFAGAAPPDRVQVRLAHDEALAHRLTAAADLLLMPSRYEPCGLNQMYAQRYGAVPVVRRTGGLADTVVDADARALAGGSASGVRFDDADAGGVVYGVRRGLELIADAEIRGRLRRAGMSRDFSWDQSAQAYAHLYAGLPARPAAAPGAQAAVIGGAAGV